MEENIEKSAVSASKMTEANACRKKRNFAYKKPADDGDKSPVYYRTVIAVDAVCNALEGHHSPKEIMNYMASRFQTGVECHNKYEKPALCLCDHFPVNRYVKAENRTPKFYEVRRKVMMGDIPVMATAHLGFESEGGKAIELVLLKLSKPNMTQKGRGNAFNRDFLIYSLILLGRKLGYSKVTASIYFLRKTGDSYNFQGNDENFFGTNVISFTDIYKGEDTEWDKQMKARLSVWENGISEDDEEEEACEYCDARHLCKKFNLPPKEVEQEEDAEPAAPKQLAFTPAQQQAINIRKGVIRLLSVAGSGKTTVIVERIVSMLLEGIKPEEILAVTFTVAGAKVMKKRIAKRYAELAPKGRRIDLTPLTVATFNAFMHTIAAENWKELGYEKQLKVLTRLKNCSLIDELLCEHPITKWDYKAYGNYNAKKGYQMQRGALRIAELVFNAIKKCDALGIPRSEFNVRDTAGVTLDEIGPDALKELMDLYEIYDSRLKEQGLIDFDDQERLAFKVMELGDGKYYENTFKFKHIIVDEFQDTSLTQIKFVRYLKEHLPTYESLMAVGDDFQSIYGFRNTSPEFFINLSHYIGEPVIDIVLDVNYRSTQEICDFANEVIAPNSDKVEKTLISAKGHGKPVVVMGYYTAQNEIDAIIQGVKQQIKNVKPSDITIEAFTKAELQKFADALTKAGIPSNFAAPEVMIENSRVYALLLFARLIYDRNNQDALTVANALIGGGIMEKDEDFVNEAVEEVLNKAETIRSINDETAQKQLFLEFVDEITFGDEVVEEMKEELEAMEYEEIIDYCKAFRRFGEDLEYRRLREHPGVKLITVHSFKGDESPIVYLSLSKFNKGRGMLLKDVEEMRRLFFVGATRAQKELYVTGTFTSGTKANPIQNRFLYEAYQIAGKMWPV